MKILLVNNYYYYRGGDCTYLFSLKKLLEDHGHKVSIFTMHHPQNIDSEYSENFVSYINYEDEIKSIGVSSGFKVLKRTIYSAEARNKLRIMINNEKPDIAHLQNIHHHITPSILYELRNNKIPTVWTLHDYTMICPNTSFLSHGRVCEKCKKSKYYWPTIERCKKDSIIASTVAALESILHRIMNLTTMVDYFIAPSNFLRDKFIEYGFDADKITRVDLFSDIECEEGPEDESDYYMYVGRIAEEKGIKTLIEATVELNLSKLKIVGNGPLFVKLIEYTRSIDKNNLVEFVGYKNREEIINLYRHCKFVVVPSEWYEISGLIIFEAFSCGKPVIGSRIGGIPEIVKDTERGLVFEMGNKKDLSAAIKYLINNPDLAVEMGKNAKAYVEREHRSEIHYEKLLNIYEKAISNNLNVF